MSQRYFCDDYEFMDSNIFKADFAFELPGNGKKNQLKFITFDLENKQEHSSNPLGIILQNCYISTKKEHKRNVFEALDETHLNENNQNEMETQKNQNDIKNVNGALIKIFDGVKNKIEQNAAELTKINLWPKLKKLFIKKKALLLNELKSKENDKNEIKKFEQKKFQKNAKYGDTDDSPTFEVTKYLAHKLKIEEERSLKATLIDFSDKSSSICDIKSFKSYQSIKSRFILV